MRGARGFGTSATDGPFIRSPRKRSTSLIVDRRRPSMLSTHDDSHGAGQTRPVISGKLFVASSAATASP